LVKPIFYDAKVLIPTVFDLQFLLNGPSGFSKEPTARPVRAM